MLQRSALRSALTVAVAAAEAAAPSATAACVARRACLSTSAPAAAASTLSAGSQRGWSSSSSSSSSSAYATGAAVAAALALLVTSNELANAAGNEDAAAAASDATAKKKKGFKESIVTRYENRLRQYSNPDKIFRYFATKELDGEVYMTPADFIRSVIPGEMQPQDLGLDQFEKVDVESFEKKMASFSGGKNFFALGNAGLLSFSEYIFLLTILSTPERRFEIAFRMFDLDGNGTVDLTEFQQVQSVIRRQFSGRSKDRASKQAKNSASDSSDNSQASGTISRSPLLLHFFGKDGSKLLTYAAFKSFVHDLQSEINKIEFQSYSRNEQTISEVAFAELLLSYADLKDEEDFVLRAKSREGQKPVTFKQFQAFNNFLKNIDDVEMALGMYTAAGASITKDDFKRAAKAVANVDLDNHIVDTVFNLFDKDGDGKLSNREFVAVMKKRASRGLDQHRDLGVVRGFKGLLICAKDKMKNMD
ncbi:Cbara1 protein [Capsaspora owczarzaki ATCC 30864]|uniref:Cbara1 protein n=1 Tax=Capsaspora owczarzaki (strain ATCC 30864) TaxID=595528 RepID=A0A0D2X184_CAPO3|nr:Cbara1 protein [Capsaspora owczarzaki ATCC 30864]KJE90364.1 Cbara1 protein [Capsaspora owczarzaki ATCC 30864]|eukprot:XP_004364554.1 Cbara1 protein [Capsaspora owczarzaki ATCC 30864]